MDESGEKGMTQPRNTIVSLDDTPYYHCVSRCVRRAFLCGKDAYSGEDYEHRRQWLEDKLHTTVEAFAIKLCAYAVMNNHYHVVLHVRRDLVNGWSDQEVIKRWHSLFSGNLLSQRFIAGESLKPIEMKRLSQDITIWRARLCDISWFMRIVNEAIARRANAEDNCTGRFWEGRYKSQALLDERALLSCMAYVDLNPIRATMANTPEDSEHTSIKRRIECTKAKTAETKALEEFVGSRPDAIGLPFNLIEYIELVDWTGRILREDKRGHISADLPHILERLSFEHDAWRILTTQFEHQFHQWVGSEHIVRQIYKDKHYQRIPSTNSQRTLLG